MRRLWPLLLLLPSLALAVPLTFTCDPNPAEEQVTEYLLYVDGVLVATTPVPPWGPVDIVPGRHVVTARAKNVWGLESGDSVPVQLPALATAPGRLRKGN